jgi:hypothetical protein
MRFSSSYTLYISFNISHTTLDGKEKGLPDACFGLGIRLLHTGQLNSAATLQQLYSAQQSSYSHWNVEGGGILLF